jgi:hypothetical protein
MGGQRVDYVRRNGTIRRFATVLGRLFDNNLYEGIGMVFDLRA